MLAEQLLCALMQGKKSVDWEREILSLVCNMQKDELPNWLEKAVALYFDVMHKPLVMDSYFDVIVIRSWGYALGLHPKRYRVSAFAVLFCQGNVLHSLGLFDGVLYHDCVSVEELRRAYKDCQEEGFCLKFDALMGELLW